MTIIIVDNAGQRFECEVAQIERAYVKKFNGKVRDYYAIACIPKVNAETGYRAFDNRFINHPSEC